jgi:hypothetical protein
LVEDRVLVKVEQLHVVITVPNLGPVIDGGSKDLWNVGKLLPDYTALQPRRQPSSYSPPCSLGDTLMMEAVSTSETSVNFYQTTRRNAPEDSHLHIHSYKKWPNLSYNVLIAYSSTTSGWQSAEGAPCFIHRTVPGWQSPVCYLCVFWENLWFLYSRYCWAGRQNTDCIVGTVGPGGGTRTVQ